MKEESSPLQVDFLLLDHWHASDQDLGQEGSEHTQCCAFGVGTFGLLNLGHFAIQR